MTSTADPVKVYTLNEGEELFGVSVGQLRAHIQRDGDICGVLPIRIGRKTLLPKEAIDRLLEDGKPPLFGGRRVVVR